MHRLYKDPKGEKCDTSQIRSTVEFGKSGAFTVVSDKEKIDRLQNEVMELKSQLEGRRHLRRKWRQEDISFIHQDINGIFAYCGDN
uniref:Uncharacterized protein n=1 Tax=Amphimedon queenslandica TaxID=400682 RepID=A0A1X7U3L9_AMPQE